MGNKPGPFSGVGARIGACLLLTVLAASAPIGCEDGDGGCPTGQMPGACGLAGECVACVVDADCGSRWCSLTGTCVLTSICGTDLDCLPTQACVLGRCEATCEVNGDCSEGSYCGDQGFCRHERCTAAGTCPEGWVEIEGSLACALEGECPDGLMPGACGLEGRCVECGSDADCASGQACVGTGTCMPEPTCEADTDCEGPAICGADQRCHRSCFSPFGCGPSEACDLDLLYCLTAKCGPDKACPAGWAAIPGIIDCALVDCPVVGKKRGVCGLSDYCLECTAHEDCEAPESCLPNDGRCALVESDCGTDADCDPGMVCSPAGCIPPCTSDADCPGTYCDAEHCVEAETCLGTGACPTGWVEVPGTMSCSYAP